MSALSGAVKLNYTSKLKSGSLARRRGLTLAVFSEAAAAVYWKAIRTFDMTKTLCPFVCLSARK